jgi:predicted O-linked N-acetylglucosamine transferase (SPINDLY family)
MADKRLNKRSERVRELMQSGRLNEARALANSLCNQDPGNVGYLLMLAATHARAGDGQNVVASFRRALTLQPGLVDAYIGLASFYSATGKQDDAIACYREALGVHPHHPGLLNNLGNLFIRLGKPADAVSLLERAALAEPDYADACNGLGVALKQLGRTADAEKNFRRAIELNPGLANAWQNLGELLSANGDLTGAEAVFRRLLDLDSRRTAARFVLGQLLALQGRFTESLAEYGQLVGQIPESPELLNARALAFTNLGRFEDALADLRRIQHINPGSAIVHNNAADMLLRLGRVEESRESLRKALEIDPNLAEAHCGLGNLARTLGDFPKAASHYDDALRLRPGYAVAHNNLGTTLADLGRLSEAERHYREALRLDPRYADAWFNLGNGLQVRGAHEESVAAFENALAINPEMASAHSNLLLFQNYRSHDPDEGFRSHRDWANRHTRGVERVTAHANTRDPERRLRIGYVSPDLRAHSVAFFLEPLLRHHDRKMFDIWCYSDVRNPDDISVRLQSRTQGWQRICGRSDSEVAEMIRADQIDILVDLVGHTGDNRLLVFAHQPAPVQVAYLGYPNTTGLDTIQYRLTDAWADPPGATDSWHSERLVRLPDGFLCYAPLFETALAEIVPQERAGMITFGSFNAAPKISPETIEAWANVLLSVPRSRLYLKSRWFADSALQAGLREQFMRYGIADTSILLQSRTPEVRDHLAQYHAVDIALDTFPYNGATTTCEALWMGVPVVTLAGRVHAARVGVSLLSQVGLPELIAADPDEYVRIAADLARDAPRRAALRRDLRSHMAASSLCDAPAFARKVEDAYRAMWLEWCRNTPNAAA